jgi:isopenicillin-N epimerase
MLDPAVTHFNHGSFGACPRPVFEAQQAYQRALEANPVGFLSRVAPGLMTAARQKLAAYLGAGANDVCFFTNPTTAFSMALRSLKFNPGDEILTSEFEYGAMDRGWQYVEQTTGAKYIHQHIPFPIHSAEEFIEAFWAGVTDKTRVVFLSHISSGLATIYPIQEIIRRARERGIMTFVDGAHAPSQIPLNLTDLGVDLYFGACHKWLSAPKGSGFLYARPEIQHLLTPLVISYGWQPEGRGGSDFAPDGRSWFVAHNEGQGTRDPSPFLCVAAAIDFQEQHDWAAERKRCHELASYLRREIHQMSGLEPLTPDSDAFFSQMVLASPPEIDPGALSKVLYEDHHIVVPLWRANDRLVMRISVQAYIDEGDAEYLLKAIRSAY